MKTIVKGGLLMGAMALTACSGSSDKGPAACTSTQVDLYNSITSNARIYSSTKSAANLYQVAYDCITFKSSLGGNSCVASNLASGKNITVSYADLAPICDSEEVKSLSNGKSSDGYTDSQSAPKQNPSYDYGKVYDGTRWSEKAIVKDDHFSLKLFTVYKVEDLIKESVTQDTAYFQSGSAIKVADLDVSKPYCTFTVLSQSAYNKWSTWNMRILADGSAMGSIDENGVVALSCTGKEKWSIYGVNEILGISAEILAK